MKKISIVIVSGLCLLQYACKKDPQKETGPAQSSDGWLIDKNTGWQHVNAITYEKPAGDAQEGNNNALTAYDLTAIGDEFGVLYAAKFYKKEVSSTMAQFYKVRFRYNDANVPAGTKLQAYDVQKEQVFFNSQLIPNSLIPIFTRPGTGVSSWKIFDENNTSQGEFPLDYFKTTVVYNYTADATFVASGNDYKTFHYWTTKYPSSGYIKNTRSARGDNNILIPMKLSDGSACQLAISTKSGSSGYQVFKLDAGNDYNETVIDAGTLTDCGKLQETTQSLVAIDFDRDVLTFVVADYVSTPTGSDVVNKVHCYRWNQRTKGITKLWSCATTPDFTNAVLSFDPNENMFKNRRITPDGTFYTIYTKTKYGIPNSGKEYTAIYTANASGVQQLGKVDQLYESTVALSHCRYINGAYYALAYPNTDQVVKKDDPKFHMELVKFIP